MVVKITGAPSLRRADIDLKREFKFQHDLSFKNCPSILDAYGSSLRNRDQAPYLGYIYMDFAPFGDLLGVIKQLEETPQ